MPVTPRVGIAAATIIITMAVISSPRVNPQVRRQHLSSTWTSMTTKSRKKAAGVEEENPMGVPRRSMVVYGAPTPMTAHRRQPTAIPRRVTADSGPVGARVSSRSWRAEW